MQGGMFVTLYDENTLKLYLNRGLYGFLMKPTSVNTVSSRSKHYAALADYAISTGKIVLWDSRLKLICFGTNHRDIHPRPLPVFSK